MLHYRVWCYVDWLEGAEIDQSSPLQLMFMSLQNLLMGWDCLEMEQ